MSKKTFRTGSPEETETLGMEFAKGLKGGDVVGLVGELGGGKTCFVRGMARGLNSGGHVKSPSFTIINIYDEGRLPLYHIDLYRMGGADGGSEDLHETGIEEYIYSEGVSVIEWADRVEWLLKDCDIVVRFSHSGENERDIVIEERKGAGGVTDE